MDAHLRGLDVNINCRRQERPLHLPTTSPSGTCWPREQSKLWNIAMHWLLSQWHLGVMQFMAESYSRRLDGSWRTEAPNRKARSLPGNGLPPHPNLEPKNEPKWIKGCAWFGGHNLESLRLAVSLHVSSVMMGYTGCHSQYRVCQLLMDKKNRSWVLPHLSLYIIKMHIAIAARLPTTFHNQNTSKHL